MFADLVAAARRSVVTLDCDASSCIRRVSAAAESGLRREALAGQALPELLGLAEEARADRARALAAARRWEYRLVGEGGDVLHLEEAPRFDDVGAPAGSTVVLTAAVEDLAGAPASLHALAFDIAEIGLWAWDVTADRVVWSPRVFELFGVAEGRTVDFGVVAERIHADDRGPWEAAVRRSLVTGEPFDQELRIVREAGGVRWVRARGSGVPGRDASIRLLVGTVADVTEARRARSALEHTSALLERTEQLAGMGSWEWDLGSGRVAWSHGVRTLFGIRDESSVPDTDLLLPFLEPDDEPVLRAAVARAVREGTPYELELRMATASGKRMLVRVLGMADRRGERTLRLFGSLQDITGLRETELALRESEAMLARTERFAQIGSWDWDGATRTLHWSDQLYRLLARDPALGPLRIEDVPEEVLPREERQRWSAAFEEALRTGRPQELEVAVRRADGDVRNWVARIGVLRLRGRDGEQRVFGSFQDVTEQRRAAAALERSEARFRAFLEHFPGAAFIKDADSVHLYANWRTMEMTGCFDDALIGRSTAEVFPGETGAHLAETDARVLREGRSISEEYLLRTRDGREFWTHDVKFPIPLPGGERPLLGGFALDVTARKALEIERERLRLAIEQSSEMVLVTDAEDRIQYANPALLAGAGYRADELLGCSVD
ncbi:MAG: PAS domain S-box protein, partial [Pseudomonadales bacterium]|nr:PAS domain S-box protein [Pseudomonadales bacterium]